ncbi:aspartate ammonia-lyase [Thermanaeromonas toyohensis ToBE]|uniref:aspartate ammonia-lyase n=1 Tax=Thermanaeromonas toyohensis ToBE TaxID=698762 RepID=A0A1W1VXT8_9FIRM|nr:aspartate ammonia-lyase [Thermanaeromonas toyohensis]SMB98156.1 aspartate ammonia-lyase [Thermanaeromonas toyohensis ToBE]
MVRVEHDLLGEREVPATAYYGIHTLRAAENFRVSRHRVHPELIKALATVKEAAARANWELGYLDAERAQAIIAACREVAQGELEGEFILDAFQGGAGTSTNMNVNEVIANRALEILGRPRGDYAYIHPNDHVNLHQSTNDVYPTAMRVAALRLLEPLATRLAELQEALQEKEREFAGILKIGRTELQDAVPVTLGQEFSAYAQAVARDRWRLYKVEERLRQVNLGGTAVGTGLNAPLKYIYLVVEHLRRLTGFGLARAENMMDVTQNMDVFVEVSGLVKAAAVTLSKIADDLRFLSSGPYGGPAEIRLPEVQAGSSIMPGKINPVIPEMVNQVALQVMGNDLIITMAASRGQLELNPFAPLIAHALLESMEILAQAALIFRERCISGISARPERCRELLEKSSVLVTALVPYLGYDQATQVAQEAAAKGMSIREVVLSRGLLSPEELNIILSPEEMVKPGIAGEKILKKRLKGRQQFEA